MNKEIKTLEDLENFCKKNTGHGINVPSFVYIDQYFADIEKTYGNGYKAGYKDAMSVIDAIKAEIAEYLQAEGFGSEYRNDVMQIIDKHISRKENE